MKKIGLTGGIGSGKTTISRVFQALGVPVFYADLAGREALSEENIIAKIRDHFGEHVLDDKGKVIRKKLGEIVFKDKEKLAFLNGLIHPEVGRAFARFCEQHQDSPYIIKEAAIIFESGSEKQLDGVIGVIAPDDLRIRRVANRDQVSMDQVAARMKNQMDQEQLQKRCDWVIVNNDKQMVTPQALQIHRELVTNNLIAF